ncbi:hypothetical protein DENIS_2252 [Desulfonema ishimotonii]|uniref:NadR/Ttd14 AAA domain-containing protein n=1 Tax=Desulfonema ishimotonii TaxID=45657 RepID=A0A401FWC9_9BACT|nr:ATP-binding protein [Desulfonema ishimotonii]GBC61292.1 hypothetical protein DENIS_2252 [Desulfonema ishimotonii]
MRLTDWYVITGAPCSGKTTVINALNRMGFRVIHEAARAHIDGELKKGRTMAQIRGNTLAFQQHILRRKLTIEKRLSPRKTVFLDRGIPDSIGYYRLSGLSISEPMAHSRTVRYKKIFFFDRLGFQTDRVRSEDEATAARLDRLLREAYHTLGYNMVHVPVLPVAERTKFILKRL